MMGKTRIEELCFELYGSWNQHDSWQRYAMVRELRELMKRPKASGSDHFEDECDDDQTFDDKEEIHQVHETLTNPAPIEEDVISDQSHNDEDLVETEVATDPIEIEHRTLNLVPEAQEENKKLENHEGWEQMVILEVEGDVENGQEVQSREKICSAHQVFDKMSLGVQSKRRQIKCHKSWRFKFKQRKQQRGKPRIAHKLIYKGILMSDSEDHLSSSLVKEIGIEISSDRWLSNSIGCELETCETVSDEYRVPSDSLLLSGKDSLAVSAIGSKLETDLSNQERNRLCTKNKENEVEVDVWIQEQVENHSKDSVPEASWVPHMCLLLKHQVSTSHLAFNHRSSIGSLYVYYDWPSAFVRTRQSQSNFVLEYAAINAYQVCDSMSLGTKLLTNGRRKAFLKTWRFKFKHRVAPRDSKPGFEVKMKKNQELLDTSQKMQTRLVYHEEKKELRVACLHHTSLGFLYGSLPRPPEENHSKLSNMLQYHESCISLRTNRVWDPGGSETD